MLGNKPRSLAREYPAPIPPGVMIRARSTYKPHEDPERLILDNRKKRQQLMEMKKAVDLQTESDLHTDWNIRAERQAMRCSRPELDRRMEVHAFDVKQRRERLREKLRQEEQDNIEAMEEGEETILERQAKMRARIKILREQKEKERMQFVQEKYDQQFTDQCDELKSELSKREQERVCAERFQQIKLKEEMAKQQKAQDTMYEELWEKDRQEKMAREEREMKADQEKKMDLLDNLLKSKAQIQAQKEEDKRLKEEEGQLLREQEALRKLEDRAQQQEKQRRQREMRDMIDSTLSNKMRKKAREEQEQLAFDLKMLEQMLEESRNEARERAQRKMELNAEDRRYREYLERLLEEEKLKQMELEALQKEQRETNYQKQVDVWRAEHQKRKALLDEVIAGRKRQLQDRLAENEQRRAQHAKEGEDLKRTVEELERYDQDRALKRRTDNLRYQTDLRQQIQYRDEQDEERRRFQKYEHEMGMQAEREYLEKVQEILNKTHLDRLHPLRRMANTHQQEEVGGGGGPGLGGGGGGGGRGGVAFEA